MKAPGHDGVKAKLQTFFLDRHRHDRKRQQGDKGNQSDGMKEAGDQTEKQNCPPGIDAQPKLDLRVLLNDLLQPPLLPARA